MDERPEPIDRDAERDVEPDADGRETDSTMGDPTTGVAAVDRVLADVAALSGTPVAGHVAVFERAHEQLRRALDAQPDTQPVPRPDQQQGA